MALSNEFRKSGNYLFRHRSYLPLIFYPLATIVVIFQDNPFLITDLWWSVACLFISFAGLFVRILAIGFAPTGTSGRNTKKQKAEVLNSTGIYGYLRHPLYLGNFLMWLGIMLYTQSFWFTAVGILLFFIYYERIMFAEEAFLKEKFGEKFQEWSEKTPAFIPRLKKWVNPPLKFSPRYVLKREYRGVLAIIISFVYLNVLKHFINTGEFNISLFWLISLIAGLIFFIIIRILDKKTKILTTDRSIKMSDK
jgi:protein-S-isoprenylcysteine O-methyltransferase Ste14